MCRRDAVRVRVRRVRCALRPPRRTDEAHAPPARRTPTVRLCDLSACLCPLRPPRSARPPTRQQRRRRRQQQQQQQAQQKETPRRTLSASQMNLHSRFHSRLKSSFPFLQILPLPQLFFFFFRTDYMIPMTFAVTSEHIRFYFFSFPVFTLFSCCFRAVD